MLGTIIAICFSFSAYRMAKRTGRNVVLWIVMVWVLGTVFAMLLGAFGAIIDFMVAAEEDIEQGELNPYIAFWASAAGTVIGCAIATLLAGRPIRRNTEVVSAEVVDEPVPVQPN
jgi:hypothetical protein